jgi:hypothetical protein
VEYVCSICNGTYAYKVTNATASTLDALSAAEQAQVQGVIDDFQVYLKDAEYVAVAVGNLTCVSAYSIVNFTEVNAMYENFTGRAYPEVATPELFEISEDDMNLTFIGTKYDSQDYSNYTVQNATNVTGVAGCCAEFECSQLVLRETDAGAVVQYSGTAAYSSQNTTLSFNITQDEYRKRGTPYTVTVDVASQYTYQEWNDLVDADADCSSVARPSNMSSLDELLITYSDLVMETYDGETEVVEAHSYFDSVSFAGGYGLYLVSDTGKAVVLPQKHYCYNAFLGNWTSGEATFTATLLNKDTDYYSLEARLRDRGNLTVSQVQSNLVNKLYLDPRSILPEYESRESAVGRVVSATVIIDPFVKVFYEGEARLRVSGEGDFASVESQIEIRVSRVEGVVAGLTAIYQVEGSVALEADPSFERTDQHVIVSNEPIDFLAYPFMQPRVASQYSFVDVGYWYEVTLLMNDECASNHFCSLVADHTEDKTVKLVLRGSEDSDSTYMQTALSSIELAADLKFKEDSFVYDFATETIFIVGAVTVRGDKVDVLRFIGNITDDDTEPHVKVLTEELWQSAFDIEKLSVGSLVINTNNTGASNQTVEAIGHALLGRHCGTSECASGDISVQFNQTNYQNNQFAARFVNLTTLEFFNALCDFNYSSSDEVPYQLSLLDPSAGVTLEYAYPNNTVTSLRGFMVAGNVSYFGVPSTLEGSLRILGSGQLRLTLSMSDFSAGDGNIKVKSASSSIGVDRAKYIVNEEIQGTVSFAAVTKAAYFTVSASGTVCSMQGQVYGGLYDTQVVLSSDAEDSIENATFTGLLEIRQSELADLEASVRQDLQDWVETGLQAMNQSRGWVEEAYELLSQVEPNLCVEKSACGELLECSTAPAVFCAQQKRKEECVEEGSACTEETATCSSSETICSVAKDNCEGEDCCDVTVTVCHEWTSSCSTATDDNCKTYELAEDSEHCHREELSCGLEETEDQACLKRCQRTQHLYERALDNYRAEQAGHNRTQADLRGFRSVQHLTENDFEAGRLIEVKPRQLISIAAKRTLNETGLGPRDWSFELTGKVLDLSTEAMEDFSTSVEWDFYDNALNHQTLLREAKASIISRSQGELNEVLAYESAYELIEANRVSAN